MTLTKQPHSNTWIIPAQSDQTWALKKIYLAAFFYK